MELRTDLAAATLESLPAIVAVVDDSGTILSTNRTWREFCDDEPSADRVGTNYVATVAMNDDEYAQRATEGLEAVLAGDRETYSLAYPCHTDEQWFLMQATRFSVDGAVRVSVAHIDITDRKHAESVAERFRSERQALEEIIDRVDGLLQDVTDTAVSAETRQEIERRVCARLAATDPYTLAWIGRVDVTSQRLSPREWASNSDVPLEDGNLVLDSDLSHPAVKALETGDPAVIQNLDTFEDADRWWPVGAGSDLLAVAAIPLTYGEVTYGILVVFADEPEAFTDRELLVLESLADTIATAINATETRQMLTSDATAALELVIEDSSLVLTALADSLETSVTYRGLAYEEGRPLVFVHAGPAVDPADRAAHLEEVDDATAIATYEDGTLLELTVSDSIFETLAEHSAVIQRFDAADGIADLEVDLATGQSARSVYDLLSDRYDQVELLSYHENDRPRRTPQDFRSRLDQRLTDRQQTALKKAYLASYFEWPRAVSGEQLAESMDISRSTFHQHLRSAQRHLLEELFDGDAREPT